MFKLAYWGKGATALLVLSLFPCRLSAETVPLANFQAVVISEDASPSVRSAAEDLAYHLRKISGRPFPVVSKKQERSILVGPEFAPDQKTAAKEQAVISIAPETIVLSGDEQGTIHAVSLFLEEFCGVRWLWPGESGEVIPFQPDLALKRGVHSETPRLQRRKLDFGYRRFWSDQQKAAFQLWQRRTRQADQLNAAFGHSWSHIIPPDRYFSSHPEWFAEVAGKRNPAQLCISHPELRDEFFKNFLSNLDAKNLDVASVSANDGYGFCECRLCREKGSTGDAYWDFVQDMAMRLQKARPGKGVGSFAYTVGREPPEKIERFPDNVFLSMTTYSTQLNLPEGQADYQRFVRGWKAKGVNIVMREYWGTHYWMDMPVLYSTCIGEALEMALEAGMIGAYGECGKNFSTMALNYYVLTHLLWKPGRDIRGIEEDFYAAFGPAQDAVREYHRVLQEATAEGWRKFGLKVSYSQVIRTLPRIYSSEVLQNAETELKKAELAAKGTDAEGRVAFLRQGLAYTQLMTELLGLYEKIGRTGFPLEFFEWQSTVRSRRALLKTIDITEGREEYEQRLEEPFPYTLDDLDRWLARAWELGENRVKMLNASRESPALDEGLYAQALESKVRQWHQVIGHYLGKAPEDYTPLEYTHPEKR